MATSVLILPGYQGSGDEHWQTLWQKANPDFQRIEQRDWEHPICAEWVESLENVLQTIDQEVILVAHSLSCLVVSHWATANTHASIKGALLVAPPNPTSPSFPSIAEGFETTPMILFDFPSIIVASSNDPYGSLDYAKTLAKAWGSALVNVGEKGHINAASNIGFWEEGYAYLGQLLRT